MTVSSFLFSNIEQCGPVLEQVLSHLSQKTEWSFSVLMGGPDPTDPYGNHMVTR